MLKKDLTHGAYYKGECRNASIARWDENKNHFVHWRIKWGNKFTESICHPDDDKTHDVFFAEEKCEPIEEIPLDK